jgi:hypothetical protein
MGYSMATRNYCVHFKQHGCLISTDEPRAPVPSRWCRCWRAMWLKVFWRVMPCRLIRKGSEAESTNILWNVCSCLPIYKPYQPRRLECSGTFSSEPKTSHHSLIFKRAICDFWIHIYISLCKVKKSFYNAVFPRHFIWEVTYVKNFTTIYVILYFWR